MTGNVIYEQEFELCDDSGNIEATEINPESKTFITNVHELPNMDDFIPGENEIEIPESETVMYF